MVLASLHLKLISPYHTILSFLDVFNHWSYLKSIPPILYAVRSPKNRSDVEFPLRLTGSPLSLTLLQLSPDADASLLKNTFAGGHRTSYLLLHTITQ